MIQKKQALVLGLGISGIAAARHLLKRGFAVLGVDKNQELLADNEWIQRMRHEGLVVQHEDQPLSLDALSLAIASPGVPPANKIYKQLTAAGIEVIGEIELACRSLQQRCLAITGSNGKTTTTLLVEHILKSVGIPAQALGNVGVPLTAALDATDGLTSQTVVVLELSSWQLETLSCRALDAAAILNISANHLDRHGTMNAYAQAKFRISQCLKPGGKLYLGEQCRREFPEFCEGYPSLTFGYIPGCDIFCDQNQVLFHENIEFIMPGEYRGRISRDVDNMMAAYALCKEMGINGKQFLDGLRTFKKPPHRIEFVAQIKGVSYYDDSKATNIDAVIKAVSDMPAATLLIAGGMHKGSPYTLWRKAFKEKVRSVFAIGQAAEQIRIDLAGDIPVKTFPTLMEAIHAASKEAESGDSILLSPGCSSYDMFRDYKHRGDEFKRVVYALQAKEGMLE